MYIGEPVNTSNVVLPADLKQLAEIIAEDIHVRWAEKQKAKGWKYGPKKDRILKLTPCLVPYEELPASSRKKLLHFVTRILKIIRKFGYNIYRVVDSI